MKRKSVSIIVGIMMFGLFCSCGKVTNNQEKDINQFKSYLPSSSVKMATNKMSIIDIKPFLIQFNIEL